MSKVTNMRKTLQRVERELEEACVFLMANTDGNSGHALAKATSARDAVHWIIRELEDLEK
jgi:hypothetical protein